MSQSFIICTLYTYTFFSLLLVLGWLLLVGPTTQLNEPWNSAARSVQHTPLTIFLFILHISMLAICDGGRGSLISAVPIILPSGFFLLFFRFLHLFPNRKIHHYYRAHVPRFGNEHVTRVVILLTKTYAITHLYVIIIFKCALMHSLFFSSSYILRNRDFLKCLRRHPVKSIKGCYV